MCRDVETRGSVSAFAYQGTNSHVVLGAMHSPYATVPQPWIWQRRRFWYSVTIHLLLQRFVSRQLGLKGGTLAARVQCSLRQPGLAYLLQRSVHGVPVAPSTLLLEMATAAGQLLCSQDETDRQVAVASATFPWPLVGPGHDEAVLSFRATPANGMVAVTSGVAWEHLVARLQWVLPLEGMPPSAMLHTTPASTGQALAAANAQMLVPSAGVRLDERLLAVTLMNAARGGAEGGGAAFGAVLQDEPHHSGYFVHPAVADASLQLAAALWAHASGRALATATLAVYAPLKHNLAVRQAVAVVAVGPLASHHWLHVNAAPALSALSHQLRPLPDMRSKRLAMPVNVVSLTADLGLGDTHAQTHSIAETTRQLSAVVASLLGRSDTPIDQPLMEAGLDSIGELACPAGPYLGKLPSTGLHVHIHCLRCPAGSIGLRNALISNFGVDAPATVAFDYPTIEGLAGFVLHHRRGNAATSTPASHGAHAAEVRQAVLDAVVQMASALVGHQVAPDQPLMEAGLDSIGTWHSFDGPADRCMICHLAIPFAALCTSLMRCTLL